MCFYKVGPGGFWDLGFGSVRVVTLESSATAAHSAKINLPNYFDNIVVTALTAAWRQNARGLAGVAQSNP